jgi:hypothetical protein
VAHLAASQFIADKWQFARSQRLAFLIDLLPTPSGSVNKKGRHLSMTACADIFLAILIVKRQT